MAYTVFVAVKIPHDVIFKTGRIGIAVITAGSFDDYVVIFHGLVQIFNFRPVFYHILFFQTYNQVKMLL